MTFHTRSTDHATMNLRDLISLTLIVLLFCATPAWASGDSDEGGGGPGTEDAGQNFFRDDYAIDVDPASGGFSTTIQVDVPEFRGLEPNLDLSYSSSGGNGIVGVGWTLGGFSYIDRASPGRGSPNYDSNDIYLLDGQELLESCTAMGGTHCTRIQSFQRIEKTSNPDGWVITAPDGTKTTYAPLLTVSGPSATFRYAIDKVEDTNGNELDYQYTTSCATSFCYPSRIQYRDSSGTIDIRIDFNFVDRPGTTDDDLTFATGRDLRTISQILNYIEVRVAGNRRHRYELVYQQSDNGSRSLLTTVKRRGTGSGYLPDIVITYENGAAGTFAVADDTHTIAPNGEFLSGDFDGDAKSDIFYIPPGTPPSATTLLSNGDSTFQGTSNSLSGYPPVNAGDWLQGDFNGDGLSDLAHAEQRSGTTPSDLYIWYSQGDGTFNRGAISPSPSNSLNKGLGRWVAGDWNGDGTFDLAHISSQDNKIYVWQSDGTSSWTVSSMSVSVAQAHQGWWLPVDFDGDANTDLVHLHGSVLHRYHSNGDFTFTHDTPSTSGYPVNIQGGKWRAGDFNGDGKADLFHISANFAALYVWFSEGENGFAWSAVTVPSGYPDTTKGWWFPIDLNGDDRTDLYHVAADSTLRLWESKGAPGIFNNHAAIGVPPEYPASSTLYAISNMRWQSGDYDGDGRDDLLHVLSVDTLWTWLATGQVGNRLATFKNRTGGTTSVTYQPSSDWTNLFLPVGMVMHTVDTITTDDGRGNAHPVSYTFEKGLWSSSERCFLGFQRSLQILDANNNYVETITSQTDTCMRRPSAVYQRHSDDAVLDTGDGIFTYSTFAYDEETETPPYRALENDRHTYECELTSNLSNCREIRTESFYDPYANVTRRVEHGDTAISTDQRTTIREYAENTNNFIVGLIGREVLYDDVTVDGSGANLVSESRFVYDDLPAYTSPPTKGNLTNRFDWEDWSGDAAPGVFRETQFGYDAFGNLISETDPNLNTTTTVFDATYHLFPEQICTPLIPCRTQQWDSQVGVIDEEWDTNGVLTDHTYDQHGRLTITLHPDGTTTEFVYSNEGDPTKQKVRIHEPDHTADGLWRDVFIDGLGRTWKVNRENSDRQLTTYHENSERVASRSLWFDPGTESARYRTFDYDGAKRLDQVTEPSTATHSLTYGIGLVTRTDTLNKQRTNYTDAYGQIVQVDELITSPSPATYSTLFEYDDLGNLIQVTDHEVNLATFSYDTLSQKRQACDFNLGCWQFGYDPGGRMTTQVDAKSQTTTLTHDALDRLKTKLTQDGKLTTWFYDEDPAVHGASQGRLTRIVYPEGSESFRWNDMGLQEAITRCVGSDCRSVQQTFEAVRLKTLTYPDGETVVYSYDTDGHLFSLLGTDGGQTSDDYVTSMTYNPRDQLRTMVFANGVTTTLQYNNPYDALSDFTAVDDTLGTVFDAHYVYNDATQITSITSATHPKLAVTLGYDDLYRLTTVTGGQSQSFTYSPVGNIETNSAVSGTYQYGDPSKPHAVTQAGSLQYGYDANGNVTSVTDRTPECLAVVRLMRWDSENQLSWVSNGSETVSYQYNANGSRIRRSGPSVGTTHYFGKGVEVQDPDGSPSLTKYYYAGDILVARQTNGVKEFYHQDHLDSVRALSDANGAQAVRYEYAAFGEEIEKVGASENVHSFGAHRRDSESGLLYMGARYHDPVLGRFTQPDQVVPEPGDPQSWNRYSFVRNNPFNRIDPTGREDILQRFVNENFDVGATLAGAASRAVGGHDASASFFGSFGLSVVPGVGEVGDLGTLFSLDHNVGTGVRLLAAGSLVLSVATLGTSPNVGGSADELFEAGQELAESAVTRSSKQGADATDKLRSAADDTDPTVFRKGTSKESPTRLNRKAQEAEASNIGVHGVSGSTTKTPGCSSAKCSDLEAAGFPVHRTGTRRDPTHVTIELPKPVTKEDARRFNEVFGRE